MTFMDGYVINVTLKLCSNWMKFYASKQ